MASNLVMSSSTKSTIDTKSSNVVDLLVKCGAEIKNQSVAALGKSLCSNNNIATKGAEPPESAAPMCPFKSAVSSLCKSSSALFLSTLQSSSQQTSSLTSPTTTTTTNTCSSSFIDPSELMRSLYEMSKKPFLILLDCRPYTEFNNKHIKDSVHVNCRDKLIKKRLQMQKITIRDLISCEMTKSKLEPSSSSSSMEKDESVLSRLSHHLPMTAATSCPTAASFNTANMTTTQTTQPSDTTTTATTKESTSSGDDNIIVIYDDATSCDKDLMADSNPLKIVQENIKKTGIQKQCKILKGGFKQFAAMCPDLCNQKSELRRPLGGYDYYAEQQDQLQSMLDNTQMTEITPYLYLGNEQDAKNVRRLAQLGIHYILNVTKNIQFYDLVDDQSSPSSSSSSSSSSFSPSSASSSDSSMSSTSTSQFVFKRIPVNDSLNQSLKEHFDEAFEFIDEARRNNSKVLVHCQAGVSRSPTIVIAYLMRQFGISTNEAFNKVREMRPIVAPNIVFMSQLMDYESRLKASVTNTYFAQLSTRLLGNCVAETKTANGGGEGENSSGAANVVVGVDASSTETKSPIECN